MDLNDWISFAVGIIGTGIAIWQTAIINESKKRRGELQFLLAGINSSAIQKQQLWANQIALLGTPNTEFEMQILRAYVRARDDFTDIANLTIALEGAIDTETSAISSMMDKYLATIQKNNKLQAEALKNPSILPNTEPKSS